MAQPRANIGPGMTAWVGSSAYKAGQFLPSGITDYWVEYWFEPDLLEMTAGASGRQRIWFMVSVGDAKAQVLTQAQNIRDAYTLNRYWRGTPVSLSSFGMP